MNDEELRAFLNSARPAQGTAPADATASADAEVSGDESLLPPGEPIEPSPTDQTSSAGNAAEQEGGLRVPSFDELMGIGAPARSESRAEEPRPALITDPAPAQAPAQAPASVPEELHDEPTDDSDELTLESLFDVDDAVTPADDSQQVEDELVPLVLPGFSPDPQRSTPLPPVFRPEPAVPAAPATPAPATPVPTAEPVHTDPAPTQPFEVPGAPAAQASPQPATPAVQAPAEPVPARPVGPVVPVAAAAPRRAVEPTTPTEPDVFASIGLGGPAETPAPSETGGGGGDEYEPIAVTGGRGGGRKALPWVIVGGGAIIALVASVLVINGVRGSETDPTPAPAPTTTATEAPTETEEPQPSETETPATEEPSGEVPAVDVGPTWTLSIPQWSLDVDMSNRYGGRTPYVLSDGNSRAMFTLPLAESLPDSCAHARDPHVWGLQRNDDGTLEAIRPEPRCADADAAAVYDTLWGLMDATAKSARPMQ